MTILQSQRALAAAETVLTAATARRAGAQQLAAALAADYPEAALAARPLLTQLQQAETQAADAAKVAAEAYRVAKLGPAGAVVGRATEAELEAQRVGIGQMQKAA